MNLYRTSPGVILSEPALEIGIAPLRKAQAAALLWSVVPHGERFAVQHRSGELLRGPTGRLSVFGSEETADDAARKANEGSAS